MTKITFDSEKAIKKFDQVSRRHDHYDEMTSAQQAFFDYNAEFIRCFISWMDEEQLEDFINIAFNSLVRDVMKEED